MKTIVTHLSPDPDAITSCWLIKRFLPRWTEAELAFVSAGETYKHQPPDENPDSIHVDTGYGRFDHHQLTERQSATKLVFEFLRDKNHIKKADLEPLERLVEVVNCVDNFCDVYYPNSTADIYDFSFHQFYKGLKAVVTEDRKVVEFSYTILDAILQVFKNKVKAEQDIHNGVIFNSRWGKSLGIESKNEETVKLALKMGFEVVVRKNPKEGDVRIKTLPDIIYDLTSLYNAILKLDKKGTWFLHRSKNMLLNGTAKKLTMTPTPLPLQKLIEIMKRI